ncbi:hypothetical protein RMT89_14795 [Streptomyces sp. P17]|nr:hypothetical protein [Streptomyces sp. P17]
MRSQNESSTADPGLSPAAREDEDAFRSGQKVRMALVAVAVVILLWFLSSDEEPGGWRVPALQAWALNIAAATPLLALVRFRNPRAREETVTLEFELKFLSGLYALFAIVDIFSGTGTQWGALPALVFGVAVYAGIWYTNKQARARG